MTTLDDKLRPKVVTIIDTYGKSVTFFTGTKTADLAAGTVSGGVTQVVVKATPPESYSSALVDGSNIRQGDLKITIAAKDLTFTPIAGQQVTFDSRSFKVVGVMPIYSGDLVAAYTCQLRE